MVLSDTAPEEDVNEFVDKIKSYLARFDQTPSDFDIPSVTKVITLAGNNLTIACIINYVVGKKLITDSDNSVCDAFVKANVDANGVLDITSIIQLSKDQSIDADNKLYTELYAIIMGIGKIMTSAQFQNADPTTQDNILSALKLLIIKTIKYVYSYISSYKVISSELVDMNNNLLLLYIMAVKRQANVGTDITELIKLYDDLVVAVTTNLRIYEEIGETVFKTHPDVKKAFKGDINELINALKYRLAKLQDQRQVFRYEFENIRTRCWNVHQKYSSKK